MKLYFRLLSRAITPVVLAAACVQSAPAVAMHHNNNGDEAPQSQPISPQRDRIAIEAPSTSALVHQSSRNHQRQAIPEAQPAQDLMVRGRPFSEIFQSVQLPNFLSSLEGLHFSDACDTIARTLNEQVRLATRSLRVERHTLKAQDAELTSAIQGHMQRLARDEDAVQQLLETNDSKAEEALEAYGMGIAEVKKLSARQADNKARTATLQRQAKEMKEYGSSAIEAVTQEFQRLQLQGSSLPTSPDGVLEENGSRTVLALPKTLEDLRGQLITTDIQGSQKALQEYQNGLECALESMQLSSEQKRDALKVSGWLGRIEGELDQKWAEAEKRREEREALELAARQKKEAEEAAAERSRREAPYRLPLSALENGYKQRFEKSHTNRGRGDHDQRVARFNEGVIRKTALALKEHDPAEIQRLVDLLHEGKRQEISGNEYFKNNPKQCVNVLSGVDENIATFYTQIIERQRVRRAVAQELFAGLSDCSEEIFKARVLAQVQQHVVSTDQDADGEDYLYIGINDPYIRSGGYPVQLRAYKEYVERTFRWLALEDKNAAEGILEALKAMEKEAQEAKESISASTSTASASSFSSN